MAGTALWTGGVLEGSYLYYVYNWPAEFTDAIPANYILCKTDGTTWEPIFIGQTEDLSELLDSHQAMPGIDCGSATHIHVHFNAWEAARLAEEADLLRNYNTPHRIQVRHLPRLGPEVLIGVV